MELGSLPNATKEIVPSTRLLTRNPLEDQPCVWTEIDKLKEYFATDLVTVANTAVIISGLTVLGSGSLDCRVRKISNYYRVEIEFIVAVDTIIENTANNLEITLSIPYNENAKNSSLGSALLINEDGTYAEGTTIIRKNENVIRIISAASGIWQSELLTAGQTLIASIEFEHI